MNTYTGDATLTARDGSSCVVSVVLVESHEPHSGMKAWGGRVTARPQDEGTMWSAFDGGGATLTLEGRSGEILLTSYSVGGTTSEIQGSGPTPF